MIIINFDNNKIEGKNISNITKKTINEVLNVEKINYDISVNISIVSKNIIKKINNKHRNINKITDVLSFPNISFNKPSSFKKYVGKDYIDVSIIDLNNNTIFLGDIIVCEDKVISQAKKIGHSSYREYIFLIIHSMLHLLGYDHINNKDEKIMIDKQKKILFNLLGEDVRQ